MGLENVRPRVAILSIHPAPYRDPVLNTLYRRNVLSFTAIQYFSKDNLHLEWNWEKEEYPNIYLGRGINIGRGRRLQIGILDALRKGKYDVIVIPGYSRLPSMLAIAYAMITNKKYIISADSVMLGGRARNRGWVKKYLVKSVLLKAAAVIVPGKASRAYMNSMGAPDGKIFEGGYCFDTLGIATDLEKRDVMRTRIRSRYEIPLDAFVFLAVGNMIEQRRYDLLIKAFGLLNEKASIYLMLIGDGPTKSRLLKLKEENGIEIVKFIPPVSFHDLSQFYASCDAYVHPGDEPFSTATEYAALAGLPIVSTSNVGYIYELEGAGGEEYLHTPQDPACLAENIEKLAADRFLAEQQGMNYAKVASKRNADWAAREFEKSVSVAMNT